jgi:MFS family permease
MFIGGAYTAANPLAMEYSPKNKRGLYGALIHVGYPAALLCTSLLAVLMLAVAPAGDANSAYATWGWRVPFGIGALLSGALFFYYYWLVPESVLWRLAPKSIAPLKELFSGADLRRLGQLFIVMSGAWLTLNATIGALPGVINTVLGVKSSGVNTGILIGAAVAAVLYPFLGLLSQRFGRRPTIMAIGLLNLVPACMLYYVLVASGYRDPTTLIILVRTRHDALASHLGRAHALPGREFPHRHPVERLRRQLQSRYHNSWTVLPIYARSGRADAVRLHSHCTFGTWRAVFERRCSSWPGNQRRQLPLQDVRPTA